MIRWALLALGAATATNALARPADRIVTLAPHLAEIAHAAGLGAKLVGVSAFSTHPPEAERLPVGGPLVGAGDVVDLFGK